MKDNSLTNTLMQIAQLSKGIEIDLDQNGHWRSLTTTSKGGLKQLFSCPTAWLWASKTLPKTTYRVKVRTIDEIDAFYIAHEFINLPGIKDDLRSANIELEIANITPFAFGYRISCKQMAGCADKKMLLPVYGGALHMSMNKEGEIFSLTSTLQYGQIKSQPEALLSKTEAIRLASAGCKHPIASACANLMLVAHNGQLELAYEVTFICSLPGESYTCLVLANTGKIIERRKRAHKFRPCNGHSRISALVKARALLKTPDPNKPIPPQVSKVIVEHLPNPQVLRNAYLDMFTSKHMDMVYAKADGSYCYSPSQAEFAAVSVFLTLAKQLELYLQSGMTQPEQSLAVVVNDTGLKDNAYFDPLHYEIHLGVGTGVEHGGLTEHIAYDLGVANHEFGHVIAHWQSVSSDLAGAQGAALNEAIGDVLGTLVMDYLCDIWYAKQLGNKLTKRNLKDDARVIGKYSLPPFGIRTQKNSRSVPADLTGEPHADGLIIGGALADLLIAMATQPGKSIEEQIKLFVKINLMAVALLPGHRVMFTDMLRALITADQQICAGQYRPTIEHCFNKHGIACSTASRDQLRISQTSK